MGIIVGLPFTGLSTLMIQDLIPLARNPLMGKKSFLVNIWFVPKIFVDVLKS